MQVRFRYIFRAQDYPKLHSYLVRWSSDEPELLENTEGYEITETVVDQTKTSRLFFEPIATRIKPVKVWYCQALTKTNSILHGWKIASSR